MRRAAATRKWPTPNAGSQTVRASRRRSRGQAASRRRRAPGRARCRGRARPARTGCSSCRWSCGRCRRAVSRVKVWRDGVVAGDQLEQGLVDRAELLGAEVAEVDQPLRLPLGLDDRERPDRGEQLPVGELGAGQDVVAALGRRGRRGRAGRAGLAVRPAERVQHQRDGLPEVVVAAAVPAARESRSRAEEKCRA